jgi:predicted PhzF superfamily epimerase YddE/YHI9
MAVYDRQEQVATLRPDMERIKKLETFGVIATAPGEGDIDFVSRFFAPRIGVPEDSVSCSAHRSLVPYWANRLGKTDLTARQLSPRGGRIHCRLLNGQVFISGRTSTYLEGKLTIR